MEEWSQISYRGFWDVPRIVIARRGDETFLFDSRFDDSADCHTDYYEVLAMPPLSEQQLRGSWSGLENLALGQLPSIGLHDLPFVVHRRGQERRAR